MAISLKCMVFALIFAFLLFGSSGARHAGRKESLHKKAARHYEQLVRTLMEIKESGVGNLPTTLIAASGNHKKMSDDVSPLILASLLGSYPIVQNIENGSVTNVLIFNNATVNFSGSDKKKKSRKSRRKDKGRDGSKTDVQLPSSEFPELAKSSEELSAWVAADMVRPLNVTLKREGNLVRVTFDVLRTEPAVVSHTWTFDGERKYLNGPTDYGLDAGLPVTSPVDFVFNASRCPPTLELYPRREVFSFSKRSINLVVVSLTMPTCILDVMNGMRENGRQEVEWNEPEDEYSQTLHYPTYWNQMNTSSIQTVKGENATFDMEIALGEKDDVLMEGIFYSNATGDSKITVNTLSMRVSNRGIDIQSSDHPGMVKLLDAELLNQNQIEGSIPGLEYKSLNSDSALYHVLATLRVTLMIADRDVSGMLHIEHECMLPFKRQESTSILSLKVMKTVQILPPNQKEVIPEGKYLTQMKQKFRCGSEVQDFSDYQGHGDNCTFFCSIVGTDLRNIRVKKVSGGITPVQKYAEVNSHNAILVVNLGPSRKEIDGEYECRAMTIGGERHRWKVRVFTWGFPKVKETTLDIQKESAKFVCLVASERPVDVFTSLYKELGVESYRIDDKPNVTRSLSKHGNETRMEVMIPTSYLRWPNEFLACEVENEDGFDTLLKSLKTDRESDYYFQTGKAFFLRDESMVIDDNDGFVTVKCVTKGSDLLEINFYFNPFSAQEEIVKSDSMSIATQGEGDKTTTMLKILKASLHWPRHTLSCRAKTEHGEESIDFELAKVIHDYRYNKYYG